MIVGQVNPYGEPEVELTLNLGRNQVTSKAIIDTGFNGYLSVPKEIIAKSEWEHLGFEDYELASGERLREEVFWGSICFGGELLQVYILGTPGRDILIGTRLLTDKTLWIDFRSGEVRIGED